VAFTEPALLAGLWVLLAMLNHRAQFSCTVEQRSLDGEGIKKMGIPNHTQGPQGPRRNSHGGYSSPTRLLRQTALSEAVSQLPASTRTRALSDHYQCLAWSQCARN